MRNLLLWTALILMVLSAVGCNTIAGVPDHNYQTSLDGPALPGSQSFVLTAPAIDATAVTLNNATLDTASVSAINDSAATIFASNYSNGVVITSANPGSTDFSVDFAQAGQTVSDIYYGVNIQIASAKYLTNPVYQALAKQLKIDIIRFPGGQERVEYVQNPAANFSLDPGYQYLLSDTDVANYITFCRNLGCQADPEFNVTNNNPDMWKAMTAQIVNGLGYNLKYLSVGNEPDVNPIGNWDYLGATTMDGAVDAYMSRYLTYAAAIRMVQPGVTFMLGELGQSTGSTFVSNLQKLVSKSATSLPGAYSTHWYLLGDWGQSPLDPGFPSLDHLVVSGNNGVNIRELSGIVATARAKIPSGSRLVIGEWGSAWSATASGLATRGSLATAIYTAEVLEYGKTLGIDSMQYFSLSDPANFYPWNISLIVENQGAFTVRPAFYVRMLYKNAWGNTSVPVTNGQQDQFSIYASKDNVNNYLMLINRTTGSAFKKTLRIVTSNHPGGTLVDVLILPKSVTVIKLPPAAL